jgi:hypothetical protein
LARGHAVQPIRRTRVVGLIDDHNVAFDADQTGACLRVEHIDATRADHDVITISMFGAHIVADMPLPAVEGA